MRTRRIFIVALSCTTLVCSLYAFQEPFRQYPGWEYSNFPLPPDWQKPGEWTFARLMYPSFHIQTDWQFRPYFDWRTGRTNWTIDYPRSDRHLSAAIRRLTRIDAHDNGFAGISIEGAAGGRTLVDATSIDYGRDVQRLIAVQAQVEATLVCITGFNRGDFAQDWVVESSREGLRDLVIRERLEGID